MFNRVAMLPVKISRICESSLIAREAFGQVNQHENMVNPE
jgi:hypothetical protein